MDMEPGPSLFLIGDLDASFDRFGRAVERFFSNFGDIAWGYAAIALLLGLALQICRGIGWSNALKAAYPETEVRRQLVVGSFLVGAGMNGVLPARGGDALKIVLTKRSIPNATYPTVISSFAILAPFDSTIGFVVLGYAITQGLFPAAPRLPDLPAFDISFWAQNPIILAVVIATAVVAFVVGGAMLRRRATDAWSRLKQGLIILRTPRRYLAQVVSWQIVAWFIRFASFWFFLEAFRIGGSIETVLLVMSVLAVSSAVPFTPGGAGAQQALLVAALTGPPRTVVLAYSVGQQLLVTAFSFLTSMLALFAIFRTTGLKDLLREGRGELRAGAGEAAVVEPEPN